MKISIHRLDLWWWIRQKNGNNTTLWVVISNDGMCISISWDWKIKACTLKTWNQYARNNGWLESHWFLWVYISFNFYKFLWWFPYFWTLIFLWNWFVYCWSCRKLPTDYHRTLFSLSIVTRGWLFFYSREHCCVFTFWTSIHAIKTNRWDDWWHGLLRFDTIDRIGSRAREDD